MEEDKTYYESWNGFRLKRGTTAANNNIKHFNQYEKKELSFLHMKYLFMKNNELRELTSAKLMEWMQSLGWIIRPESESLRNADRYNTIEELEEVYGSGQIR